MQAMGESYDEIVSRLRRAYDRRAGLRDRTAKDPWKVAERAAFADRFRAAGGGRLLEVGAGTGQDSQYFAGQGATVSAIDLSPQMVAHCRAKDLDARVMDFRHLDFPAGHFDAVYALNCLLHVPNADLVDVLRAISGVLRPGGLFFLGVYGGEDWEGVAEHDQHDPPRFFSFRSDAAVQRLAGQVFEIVDFHVVQAGDHHFQSLTLRRPEQEGR